MSEKYPSWIFTLGYAQFTINNVYVNFTALLGTSKLI